jgi:hypothetical protein
MDTAAVTRLTIVGSLLIAASSGCGGDAPTAPSIPLASAPSERVTVTAIQPGTGPASGTTVVRVSGSGFRPGAIVTLGAVATEVTVVDASTIVATVSGHAAGAVDVVVTNPAGDTGRLRAGFVYVGGRPIATGVSPNVGSTDGGTILTIAGTDLEGATTVAIGGVALKPTAYQGLLYVVAPPHDAGSVDVVVSDAAGHSVLGGGYTYAEPDSFDFNGQWEGGAGSEGEIPMRFTIESDMLTTLRCGGSDVPIPAPGLHVRNGSFLGATERVSLVSGRILSGDTATGSIDTPACREASWYAIKQRG